MFTTILASELLFMMLVLLALERWSHPALGTLSRGLSGGVLLGIATLVRPIALPLPLIFAASSLVARGERGLAIGWRRELVATVVASIAMLAVISPWAWRNYELYGELVLVSTNGGITFWMGNTPGTNGAYAEVPDWALKLRDNERSRALSAEALQYIAAEPLAFVLRTFRKVIPLYSYVTIAVTWNESGIKAGMGAALVWPLKLLTTASWFAILAGAIAGVLLAAYRRLTGMPPALLAWPGLTVIFLTFVHGVTVSQDRYHLAFAPQIAMIAALSLAWFYEQIRGKSKNAIGG
jgi:hypothetical protein